MYNGKMVYAIILAAGKGTRIGFDKMLYQMGDVTVIEKSVLAFEKDLLIDQIYIVAGDNRETIKELTKKYKKVIAVINGGSTRAQSVTNAIEKIKGDGLVAIHDGARPFVSDRIITQTVTAAAEIGAAVPCVGVKDTIKQSNGGFVRKSVDRDTLFTTQTPQIFDLEKYREYSRKYFDRDITDDSQLFERAGAKVKITQGEYSNYKITTIDDIKQDVKKDKKMRIGHGYDVHRLVENRKLIIGGTEIPFKKGLLGHSDADVLIHAIMDSLLGALALGDIGKYFSDSDEKYRGANSMELLSCVAKMLEENGAEVENIDTTILCEAPKLAKFIPQMRVNIADTLKIDIDKVSVKATTEEGLGFTGESLGISAHSVCILKIL